MTHKYCSSCCPPSPLNKSKCKNFNELEKIEELLVSIVIIIQKIMDFIFPETLEVSKKGTNNQCAMQQYLAKSDTLYSGIKKVIKLSNKVVSQVQ